LDLIISGTALVAALLHLVPTVLFAANAITSDSPQEQAEGLGPGGHMLVVAVIAALVS